MGRYKRNILHCIQKNKIYHQNYQWRLLKIEYRGLSVLFKFVLSENDKKLEIFFFRRPKALNLIQNLVDHFLSFPDQTKIWHFFLLGYDFFLQKIDNFLTYIMFSWFYIWPRISLRLGFPNGWKLSSFQMIQYSNGIWKPD